MPKIAKKHQPTMCVILLGMIGEQDFKAYFWWLCFLIPPKYELGTERRTKWVIYITATMRCITR